MSEPKADVGQGRARRARIDPAASFLEWFEGLLRRVVREELAAARHPVDSWRDQRDSPLGARNHCRAVRRRLEANPQDPGARILGKRFLLKPDALDEELERLGHKPEKRPPRNAEKPSPEAEALTRVRRRLASIGRDEAGRR